MGVAPEDSEDLRLKKVVLTITATSIALLALFWGGLYIHHGYPLSGAIRLGYSVISFSSILYFFRAKRFAFFCTSQQLLILLLPFLLMWSLGGFANGSVVMIWAVFAPLAALFFIDLRRQRAGCWLFSFCSPSPHSSTGPLPPMRARCRPGSIPSISSSTSAAASF